MSCSDYRARARQDLTGKWAIALLAALAAGILGGLVTGSLGMSIDIDAEIMQELPPIVQGYLLAVGSVASLLALVRFVLGGVVRLGYCRFLLKMHDGEEADIRDVFSQFSRFTDGFLLDLLTGLFVALWSLLLVIPGIIASYRYAMAPFLMMENPGMKAREALGASTELMDGHKGELFLLDLSFIGWDLLNALTLGIGSLWLNPYRNAAYAAFYRSIRIQALPEAVGVEF